MMNFNIQSQTESQEIVLKIIQKTYNAKDYKGFYKLLSPSFQKQMSSKNLSQFLSENIFKYFGNIKSIEFESEKEKTKQFKTELEKGTLDLFLLLNTENQIESMTFLAHKDPIILKEKVFSDNKMSSNLDNIVDSIVKPFMRNSINSGMSISIIRNGRTTFYNYGEVIKGSKNLPNCETIYEIGSISKTFTGFLLAQAILDKKINLDDDIRKFLPENYINLEFENNPIRIKHLVNHTSTLPRIPLDLEKQPKFDSENPYLNYSKKMVLNYLKNYKMISKSGITQEYSNFGLAILGIILENIYKKSYHELLQNYITKPLKMSSTFENVPNSKKINFANGYDLKGLESKHWDMNHFVGAGGIKSTTTDMSIYLHQNIDELNSKIKLSHEITFSKDKTSSGFAWVINKTKENNTFIWHNGGTGGFTSFCGFIKEKKCGIVILNNSASNVDSIAISILKNL